MYFRGEKLAMNMHDLGGGTPNSRVGTPDEYYDDEEDEEDYDEDMMTADRKYPTVHSPGGDRRHSSRAQDWSAGAKSP